MLCYSPDKRKENKQANSPAFPPPQQKKTNNNNKKENKQIKHHM
jgi:hypothetical protein